ncbi:MAG: ABC transporter permease [Alteromonadaceae bacterium]|nr:ABC transporter permease [Alteromonadaceae bacterium]
MSSAVLQPPSAEHWLGTDDLGRDWLQRLVQAFPATLLIAFLCGLLPLCMGLLLASVSTIGGVWLDRALLKMTDIFLIIPSLLPLMILSAILEPGLPAVVVLISAVSWPDDFRVLRAAIRRQQLGDAIFSARSFGAGRGYLLRHHVWPALVPLMEVLFIQNARRAVMLSAGLAFLGLTDPRMSNWGTMLFEAQEHMHLDAFWWMLPGPLFAMTVLILLLNSTHAGPEKSAL